MISCVSLYSKLTRGGVCFHRFTEKGNLEVLLFTIQSKMRANNQKVYMPREGKLISDINKVLVTLERFQSRNISLNVFLEHKIIINCKLNEFHKMTMTIFLCFHFGFRPGSAWKRQSMNVSWH